MKTGSGSGPPSAIAPIAPSDHITRSATATMQMRVIA